MDLGISDPVPVPHFEGPQEPPPPTLSSEGIVAQDITQKFLSAAASKPEQFCRDPILLEPVLTIISPSFNSLGTRWAHQGWLFQLV